MSVTSRNPLRLAGAAVNSGNINTGEEQITQGGGQAMSIFSGNAFLSGVALATYANQGNATGNGYDVLLVSGAGRLKDVLPHVQSSGVQVTFYDSAVPTSGGPFPLSGHKILGVIPANTFGSILNGSLFGAGPAVLGFDVPFQSGLCVALKSGQPGFTVTFFPETNPNQG